MTIATVTYGHQSKTFENARRVVLTVVGDAPEAWTPNYVRDRLKGAAGG